MKITLKYAGIIVAGALFLGSNGARGETLQEAIQYMLKTNPEIKSVSYNRLARDQEVVQAKAGYYPIIDLSHGTSMDRQIHKTHDTTWPKETVLSLRQNVFQFGRTLSEVRRQKARVRSVAFLLQGTSEKIGLQGSRVYLNMLRNIELDELAKENLVNHERIYDQVKLRSTAGVDRKADLDQVMARLALAQTNKVVTEANIVDAKTDYQAVIGHVPEYLTKVDPLDSAILASIEDAERLALKNHPIVKSAQADLEARESQYKVAKTAYYPSFDIAADYRWENDVDEPGYKEDIIATGVVSFNIFSGLQHKARIAETSHLISEAREILNNTCRQTVQSIRLSWEAYKAAQDRVTHLEEYVKSSGLTAEAFAQQWNIGRRTMFDVLDTQAEYINAKSELVKARYDKMYAQYRILAGIGILTPTLGLQWPEESRVEPMKKDVTQQEK